MGEEPKPGEVGVLLGLANCTELLQLLQLASSVTSVELWIAREMYRAVRLRIINDDGAARQEIRSFPCDPADTRTATCAATGICPAPSRR